LDCVSCGGSFDYCCAKPLVYKYGKQKDREGPHKRKRKKLGGFPYRGMKPLFFC